MADHLDPPAVAGMGSKDITDIYAFHPPGWGALSSQILGKTVLVLNVNPLTPPGATPIFSPDVEYLLKVDTDGDAEEDLEFEFEFSEPTASGAQTIELEMEGGSLEGEGMTGTTIDLGGGAFLRADLRDDPFFFDLPHILFGAPATGDTFAGKNVSAIVLEVPTSLLTPDGPHIGVWGAIEGSGQIDRMGRPAISTVLIPSARKSEFNAGDPEDDVEDFRADVVASIMAAPFSRTLAAAEAIAGVLLPDILTMDTSIPTEFLNGRKLDDDVIDAALTVLFGPPTSDGVPANDKAFLSTFPYLAEKH